MLALLPRGACGALRLRAAASALRPLATAPDAPQTPAFVADAQRRAEEELMKLTGAQAAAADAPQPVDPAQARRSSARARRCGLLTWRAAGGRQDGGARRAEGQRANKARRCALQERPTLS